MAGTIFGLGLMQQLGENGAPLAGCKLYLYEANTSTPADAYEDFGLTTSLILPWPMVADAAGRIPAFWVDDGSYRVRLTDADGNEIFDESSITAIGASSGSVAGGGSGVSATAIFNTGDFLWQPLNTTKTGWVRANARTIGSVASGATERANADVEDLFLHLWDNYTNALCPVLPGGRGASAATDWSANKTIGTLDMRNKAPFGLDDMGNSAVGLSGGSTSGAAAVGASTYTILQANLPNVNLSSTALSAVAASTLGIAGIDIAIHAQGGDHDDANQVSAGNGVKDTSYAILSTLDITVSMSGTVPLGGSGTQMTILGPGRAGTWYIKL